MRRSIQGQQMNETIETSMRRGGRTLLPALRTAGPFLFMGLIIGVLLLILQWYLDNVLIPRSFILGQLVGYMGGGFIISAIFMFFYEWRAYARNMAELTQKLLDFVNTSSNESLEQFLYRLFTDDSLQVPDYLKDTVGTLRRLVESIQALQRQEIWAKEQYIGFITRLVTNALVNAETLQKLNAGGEHHFKVPPIGAELADAVLAAQMQALTKGDYYNVISNLSAWKGQQLGEMHEAERRAIVNRGAKVRRLFNLTRKYQARLTANEAREILLRHFNHSREWGATESQVGYEVKVLGNQELNNSTSKLLRDRISEAHFGIFHHEPDVTIRVKVERSDLSDMVMSKDLHIISADLDLFNEAWNAASPLSIERIEMILKELEEEKAILAM